MKLTIGVMGASGGDPGAEVRHDRLIHYYRTEHHRKPSCFCDAKGTEG